MGSNPWNSHGDIWKITPWPIAQGCYDEYLRRKTAMYTAMSLWKKKWDLNVKKQVFLAVSHCPSLILLGIASYHSIQVHKVEGFKITNALKVNTFVCCDLLNVYLFFLCNFLKTFSQSDSMQGQKTVSRRPS